MPPPRHGINSQSTCQAWATPVLEGYMPVLEVKTIEPFAMSPDAAATLLSVNKRTVYRLITEKKLIARKEGSRTLVDYQSVKAHYASLPLLSGASIPNAPQRRRVARVRARCRAPSPERGHE
jgi:excisionase family DNA binding protein